MTDAPLWSEEGLMEYVYTILLMIVEAISIAVIEFVEASWNAFITYVSIEGAFWITPILIAVGSVYVITWRFVL